MLTNTARQPRAHLPVLTMVTLVRARVRVAKVSSSAVTHIADVARKSRQKAGYETLIHDDEQQDQNSFTYDQDRATRPSASHIGLRVHSIMEWAVVPLNNRPALLDASDDSQRLVDGE